MKPASGKRKPTIGWREWIALPELGIPAIKVKVDTGARSSALHASEVELFQIHGRWWVRFLVHPIQRNTKITVPCQARLIDKRHVRSSSGKTEVRPVIRTTISLMGDAWPIEVTLASRDVMGFRMLLGRQALTSRFLVDPGRSFFDSKVRKKKRRPSSRSED